MIKGRNIFKSKKGKIIGIIILIVIVAIISCLCIFSKKDNSLEENLEELGRTWYETYYWEHLGNSLEDKANTLSKYTMEGVTIDLNNLSKYPFSEGKIDLFINKKTGEKCDINMTKVTIIPKEPFGVKDYDIKINLDCGSN